MRLIICSLAMWLSTGCTPDPLGMTSRTQIRANAQVAIAAEERKAEEAQAQALVDAEVARQLSLKQRNDTIMMLGSFIAVVAGVAGVVIYIIKARKEIEIERMRLVGMPPAPQLPREVKRSLVKYNLTAEWDGRDYWAVNQAGQKLKPITYLLEVKR
jgi:hypothetical protein